MALVLTRFDSRIKIRVFGPTLDQLLVKLGQSGKKYPWSSGLMQNYEKCCFVRVLTSFDLKPRVDQGHFGHLSWKGHSRCFGVRIGYAMSFWMFLRPHGEKTIFLDFSRFGMQIEGTQNTVLTIPLETKKWTKCLKNLKNVQMLLKPKKWSKLF